MLVRFIVAVYLMNFSRINFVTGQNYDCASPIYCYGFLLHTIQLSDLFISSSKCFVETKLKNSPQNILMEFSNLEGYDTENPAISNEDLQNFIDRNFEEDKAETCILNDFQEDPGSENFINDKIYQKFYNHIHKMWPHLAVRTPADVQQNSDYHSMIYLPYCYIKTEKSDSMPQPLETYAIVRGLLSNGMLVTAAGIIRNYAYMIENNRFVLYTNRVYASTRTQLPVFALMVSGYMLANTDEVFLQEMLPFLKSEFDWWFENRLVEFSVNEQTFHMFRYQQSSISPRPEKYRLDYELIQNLRTTDEFNKYFSETRCANESGFNFSSRFLQDEEDSGNRWNLDVSNIIPVELNSILHQYAEYLAQWFYKFENNYLGDMYKGIALKIVYSINEVLWDDNLGMWFDFDLRKGERTNSYYVTNLMPLFTKSYNVDEKEREKLILDYLVCENIITENYQPNYYVIPTSNKHTGEESDYPYGSLLWNLFVIEGLNEFDSIVIENLAANWAIMLIKTIFKEFMSHRRLFEKYNSVSGLGYSNTEEEDETINESSASALGCITTLLNLYGTNASPTKFRGFRPNV